MRRWHGVLAFAILPALALPAAAQDADLLNRLDEALKTIATLRYGQDAGSLQTVDDIVIAAGKDPKLHEAVERRLVRTLAAASTRDGKSFLCRKLRTIGTARSVPQLEKLLTDPELAHMARYALGRIDDPAAVTALHRALGKTSGKVQAGIINTLADRRCRQALPDFVKLLRSSDAVVALAAVDALGRLGGTDAARALQAARTGASGTRRRRVTDALLQCAEHFLRAGRKADAARIYRALHAPKEPKHVRLGALRGLVAAQDPAAAPLVIEAIKSGDHEVRATGIALMAVGKGEQATRAFVALLPSLPPDGQELVVRALGARGDAAAVQAIAAATKSAHEPVRLAALEALGSVGEASSVPLLCKVAAAGGREQLVARASLVHLSSSAVDAALIRSASAGDAKVRAEAIRALAGRGATKADDKLLKAARDDEAAVRGEAIRALGMLVGEQRLGALLDLAMKPKDAADRPAIERAVTTAFWRVKDADKRADAVLAALGRAPADAKPTLVRLLARAGTAKALAAVRAALKDDHAAVRDAAVRTLAEWPDASPAEEILALVRSTSDATHKVLLLRGYVRMAGLSPNPTRMYARAMELTRRVDDKRRVLAGLGTTDSADALKLVERYLDDPQLGAEAAAATVQIAGRLRQSDAARSQAALKRVLAAVKSPRVRRQAQEILNEMDQYEGYLLAWMISGPYKEKGKQSRTLFDAALAPEKPGAKGVKWQRLRRGVGAWDVNLETALGSNDHCAAYVRTRVWSPADQKARLELGSDDAIKAWLNGKLVHAIYTTRGVSPRQDLVNIKLQKGWNELLLKVVEHEGGWGFCCRVRKPDGTTLDGLKVEAK